MSALELLALLASLLLVYNGWRLLRKDIDNIANEV